MIYTVASIWWTKILLSTIYVQQGKIVEVEQNF